MKSPPIKNRAKPKYLNRKATITQTIISTKYILRALKFREIASNILLFVKNMSGATNRVTATQTTASITVGIVNL
ncbi:protein of unknown function [Chryseobacterium sp. JV274]|nr:protein of unknown function [Chryseobacterium sp. JV274]